MKYHSSNPITMSNQILTSKKKTTRYSYDHKQGNRFIATLLLFSMLLQSCGGGTLRVLDDGATEVAPKTGLSSRGLFRAMSRALARGCEGPRGILDETAVRSSQTTHHATEGALCEITRGARDDKAGDDSLRESSKNTAVRSAGTTGFYHLNAHGTKEPITAMQAARLKQQGHVATQRGHAQIVHRAGMLPGGMQEGGAGGGNEKEEEQLLEETCVIVQKSDGVEQKKSSMENEGVAPPAYQQVAVASNTIAHPPLVYERYEIYRISLEAQIETQIDINELSDEAARAAVLHPRGTGGTTPLHRVFKRNSRLTGEGKPVDPKKWGMGKALITLQADVTLQDKDGRTPLHDAIFPGNHGPLISLLVAHNADPNAQESQGNTPLHQAILAGTRNMAAHLLSLKAAVDIQNNDGHTPLHLAAEHGQASLVQFLLENHAQVGVRSSDGTTPLLKAVMHGSHPIVDLLLSAPSSNSALDAAENSGRTPLFEALMHNHLDIGELLISYNASMTTIYQGDSLFGWAAIHGNREVMQLLMKYGGPELVCSEGGKLYGTAGPPRLVGHNSCEEGKYNGAEEEHDKQHPKTSHPEDGAQSAEEEGKEAQTTLPPAYAALQTRFEEQQQELVRMHTRLQQAEEVEAKRSAEDEARRRKEALKEQFAEQTRMQAEQQQQLVALAREQAQLKRQLHGPQNLPEDVERAEEQAARQQELAEHMREKAELQQQLVTQAREQAELQQQLLAQESEQEAVQQQLDRQKKRAEEERSAQADRQEALQQQLATEQAQAAEERTAQAHKQAALEQEIAAG